MITLEERKQRFIAKARTKHGSKFDYSAVEYVSAKTHVIIICPEHGQFSQTPDKHLQSADACTKCWEARRSSVFIGREVTWKAATLPVEEYLKRLSLPKPYSIDTSNYRGLTAGTVTIHCPEHGARTTLPKNVIISTYFCPDCAIGLGSAKNLKGYDQFLTAARELHGDKYEYPFPEEYVNRKSVLTVRCAEHGDFLKKAQKHLSGQGCNRCRIDELIRSGQLPGGYDDRLFAEHPEVGEEPGTLYYLKVGRHYKIGITRQRLERRLAAIRSESKQEVTVLGTVETTLKQAYVWEQEILKRFDEVRVLRRWSTELFNEDILGGDVLLKNFVVTL